jgi:hypothetical protein
MIKVERNPGSVHRRGRGFTILTKPVMFANSFDIKLVPIARQFQYAA